MNFNTPFKQKNKSKQTRSINKHFNGVKNKPKMIDWILRQYFDPTNDVDKFWYRKDVDKNNLLEHISKFDCGFPYTPYEIVDLWNCISFLKKRLKNSNFGKEKDKKNESDFPLKQEYQKGEETLKEIGKEVGNITPAMINRIVATSSEKIRFLSNGMNYSSEDNSSSIQTKIEKDRARAANEYVSELMKHQSAESFIDFLFKKNIIKKSEKMFIGPTEVWLLNSLMSLDPDMIKSELLDDIEKEDNLIKSFQYYASKITHESYRKSKKNILRGITND